MDQPITTPTSGSSFDFDFDFDVDPDPDPELDNFTTIEVVFWDISDCRE